MLFIQYSLLKSVFEDSLLKDPVEYSSEKEVLDFAKDIDSLLEEAEDLEDKEFLLLLPEHEPQLPTLILDGSPSELPKLSLDMRLCPASRSRYSRVSWGFPSGA